MFCIFIFACLLFFFIFLFFALLVFCTLMFCSFFCFCVLHLGPAFMLANFPTSNKPDARQAFVPGFGPHIFMSCLCCYLRISFDFRWCFPVEVSFGENPETASEPMPPHAQTAQASLRGHLVTPSLQDRSQMKSSSMVHFDFSPHGKHEPLLAVPTVILTVQNPQTAIEARPPCAQRAEACLGGHRLHPTDFFRRLWEIFSFFKTAPEFHGCLCLFSRRITLTFVGCSSTVVLTVQF